MIKDGELVIPGQELGTLEEYLPGENVYEVGGRIYSKVLGRVAVKDLMISVSPLKEIPRIKEGEVVIATVTEVKESIAIVEILAIEGKAYRSIASPIYTAAIPISQIANEFIKDIRMKLRTSDIVRAKVISTQRGIFLTVKPPDMGVINAFCSICRRPLRRVSGNTLRCDHCNTNETRKISELYGRYFIGGDKYGNNPRKI